MIITNLAQHTSLVIYHVQLTYPTVELLQWDSETGKFGFIKLIDRGLITTMKGLEN